MNKKITLLTLSLTALMLVGCRPARSNSSSSSSSGSDSGSSSGSSSSSSSSEEKYVIGQFLTYVYDTDTKTDSDAENLLKTICTSLFGSAVKDTDYYSDSDEYGNYYYTGVIIGSTTDYTLKTGYEECLDYIPSGYTAVEAAAEGTDSDGSKYYGTYFTDSAESLIIELYAYEDTAE